MRNAMDVVLGARGRTKVNWETKLGFSDDVSESGGHLGSENGSSLRLLRYIPSRSCEHPGLVWTGAVSRMDDDDSSKE